jgi:ParB/RepB/Spo0J family partition protein
VDLIRPSPHNRLVAPDDGSIADLAASIAERGLLQPIAVRPVGGNDRQYEIIYGERRWLACKSLGWTEIPAQVRDVDERTAQADRVTENLMRRDLSPLEEGDGVKALLELHDADVSEVAARLGRSESWVRRRAKLPNLTPAWREELVKPDTEYAYIRDSVERMEDLAILPADAQDGLLTKGRIKYARDAGYFRDAIARALFRLDKRAWEWDTEFDLSSPQPCISCAKRSDREGDLFAAIADTDGGDGEEKGAAVFCLDKTCWEAKTIRYLKSLLINNPEAVPLHDSYLTDGELKKLCAELGVARIYAEWSKCKENEEYDREIANDPRYEKRRGVVVDGDQPGDVGEVWVDMREEDPASDEDEKERRKEREKENREARERREKNLVKENAFHAIMRKRLAKTLPEATLNDVDFPGKLLDLLCNWGDRNPGK